MCIIITSIESELSDFPTLFGILLDSSVCLFVSISEEPVILSHHTFVYFFISVSWFITNLIIKVIIPMNFHSLLFINFNALQNYITVKNK